MPLLNTDEPIPDHLADTGPVQVIRDRPVPAWRRVVGLLCLIGAAALTVATALLVFSPEPSPTPAPTGDTTQLEATSVAFEPTVTPAVETDSGEGEVVTVSALPTLSPELASALLSAPVAPVEVDTGLEVFRRDFSAFTIVPDRPRSEVIQYEVQSGDTILAIADRFGLAPESIAWSNPRDIIGGLRVGRNINIPPVDGIYYTLVTERTIQSVADEYHVDPYAIIESEYNDLFSATPETVLPSGTRIMIPGGTAESISWTPNVVRESSGSGSSGRSGVGRISFAPGDPGSCGMVDNPGGGGGWVRPIGSYTWTRGFASYHTGVDLAAPEGTPVYAANGGTVIFRGWSTWGYGWAIVLAHGPYTTVYGHLSGINVGCGQSVAAGQVIGASGNSGASTGPHLHFEIRYNDVPFDPVSTIAF